MTDSYTVAAQLQFKTNATQIVTDLLASFERLDKVISATQSNFAKLSAEMRTLSTGSRGINATTKALEGLGKVRMGAGVLTDLEKITLASKELASVQASMARAAAETATAYRDMARAAPRTAPGGRVSPGGAAPGGRAAAARGERMDGLGVAMGLQMGGHSGMGFFGQAIEAEMVSAHLPR